eukprot:15463527-Alexandrium_andersonii.AAC.1
MAESAAETAGPSTGPPVAEGDLPAAPPPDLVWAASRVRDLPSDAKAAGLRRSVRSGLGRARQSDDIGLIRSAVAVAQ